MTEQDPATVLSSLTPAQRKALAPAVHRRTLGWMAFHTGEALRRRGLVGRISHQRTATIYASGPAEEHRRDYPEGEWVHEWTATELGAKVALLIDLEAYA